MPLLPSPEVQYWKYHTISVTLLRQDLRKVSTDTTFAAKAAPKVSIVCQVYIKSDVSIPHQRISRSQPMNDGQLCGQDFSASINSGLDSLF